jgi:hypothetical protein
VGGGVAIALLIGLAALPLLHPRLRRYTATAAVPLVVGGVCLGVGMAFWANLGSIIGVSSPSCPGSCPGGFLSSAGPDFGLLVFFVGAMLVVVVGYRLFLDSARASARGEAATTAPIPTKSAQPEGQRPERDRQPAAVAAISADETTAATNPKAVSTPEVVLPGSDSWSRTLDPPPILRPRAGSIRRSHR